jgi:hypothetical protein
MENVAELINLIIANAGTHNWAVVAGAAIMVLIWAFRYFLQGRLPSKWIPLIVAAVGVGSYIGTALVAGQPVQTVLIDGLLASGAATIFWSTVGKYLMPKSAGQVARESLPPKE